MDHLRRDQLGVVFGVDLDVFVGQVAGPDGGLAGAEAQVGGEADFGGLEGSAGGLGVEGERLASSDELHVAQPESCLLYTSDAADEVSPV